MEPLQIHETAEKGIYIENLIEFHVKTIEEVIYLLQRGERARLIRETKVNTKSSRSHIIFQIRLEEYSNPGQTSEVPIRRSKMCLCDLAGSEKMNDDVGDRRGGHFKELKSINWSLTNLGKVIYALSHNSKKLIPYRESKLTRI